MNKTLLNTLFGYTPVLFSFLLPFGGNYLSILIILWFIVSWFCIDKSYFLRGLKNKWFLVFILFFLIHVISAIFSANKTEALSGIELKLSFIAFPYFFFLFKINENTIKRIMQAFVSGCLFSLLFCIGRAGYYYVFKDLNYFYYTDFSYFIHAGYFSMYLLFAVIILHLAYPNWFSEDKSLNVFNTLYSLIFITGIFLCASKIGLIALTITAIMLLIHKFKRNIKLKTLVIVLVLVCSSLFVFYKLMPAPFERLMYAVNVLNKTEVDKTTTESTGVRVLIWQQALKLSKEHYLFGTGIGDANDELYKKYEENGLTGAYEHKLNAHNQFFQTLIGVGIFGISLLLLLTAGVLIYAILTKKYILFLFSLMCLINFLVESMLQTQAGTLFFVFYNCLLLTYEISANKKPTALAVGF